MRSAKKKKKNAILEILWPALMLALLNADMKFKDLLSQVSFGICESTLAIRKLAANFHTI